MTEIWAAVPTPMTTDGSLALGSVAAQATHLLASSIDGAFVTGTTGEFAALTTGERLEVMDAWAAHRGPLRIAAHVGSTSSREAQRLSAHAAQSGYQMVAAVAPFYGSAPMLDRVVDHLAATAHAAAGVDFCYYHIPSFTGLEYDVEVLVEALTARIPNFVAVKFTSPDLLRYARLREAHPGLKLYFGQDELMPAALAMGADDFIGSLYNAVGPLARRTIELFAEGDTAGARDRHALVREIAADAGKFGGLGFVKALAGLVGPDVGPAREPWGPLGPSEVAAAERLAERIGSALRR